MNKDEIWQELKNSESTIYGQPMLDVFLQTTEKLSSRHFLELNKEQIEKLTAKVIAYVLWDAKNSEDIEKVANKLGAQGFNKLDSGQINHILKADKDYYSAEDMQDKKTQTFTITDAIFKYRILNEVDISNMLYSIEDSKDLKNTIDKVGKDKLKLLNADKVYYLIRVYLKNKVRTSAKGDAFELFKIFIQALGDHINILRQKDVWDFVNKELPYMGAKNISKEDILDLIGNENLNKLTDDNLEDLRQQGWHYRNASDIAQFYEELVTSIKKRRSNQKEQIK